MKKNKAIYFRLSEDDLFLINSNAKKARMSRSKYLIQAAQNQKLEIFGGEELREFNKTLRELTAELRRIGVNVNQITVLANMGKIECVYLDETNKKISAVWDMLEKIRKEIKKIKNGGNANEKDSNSITNNDNTNVQREC